MTSNASTIRHMVNQRGEQLPRSKLGFGPSARVLSGEEFLLSVAKKIFKFSNKIGSEVSGRVGHAFQLGIFFKSTSLFLKNLYLKALGLNWEQFENHVKKVKQKMKNADKPPMTSVAETHTPDFVCDCPLCLEGETIDED